MLLLAELPAVFECVKMTLFQKFTITYSLIKKFEFRCGVLFFLLLQLYITGHMVLCR